MAFPGLPAGQGWAQQGSYGAGKGLVTLLLLLPAPELSQALP